MNLLVGEEEIVDMLIKNGADTNVENSNGKTPLNGGNSYTYSYVIVVLILLIIPLHLNLAVNGGNSYVIVVAK